MLRDFIDLQLLVIGIPSVTQFHESFYNRAFAEGLLSFFQCRILLRFFIRFKKKKTNKKRKGKYGTCAGSCISVWIVPACSDWRSSKIPLDWLAGKSAWTKTPPAKSEPINVAIDLSLMQRDGADFTNLERHNSWVTLTTLTISSVERQDRLTSLVINLLPIATQ